VAFGTVIEALTRSRFWPQMAIFVLEGRCAERTRSRRFAPVAGVPHFSVHARAGHRLLDVQHDVRAAHHRTDPGHAAHDALRRRRAAMFAAFKTQPDRGRGARCRPAIRWTGGTRPIPKSPARSARLDFSEADRIDDLELNDILWISIKGTEPPAPTRAFQR